MYKQAEPVRSPVSGPGSGRTTGPQPQSPTVHLSASRGRARYGKGATGKREEDQETSDTYEEAEEVKRDATDTSADRKYRGAASGRQTFCSFIRSHRICIEAATVVVISLVAMGLFIMFFINNKIDSYQADVQQLQTEMTAKEKMFQAKMRQLQSEMTAKEQMFQAEIQQLQTEMAAKDNRTHVEDMEQRRTL
uniref:Uncharacterized protein n=1 Tax=Branchiostoma floridae TaxID=7739 RepID=C3XSZ3_BRAFL|eukprot:XP_002612852.1 hypothetical protein BRAFLDRAFT_67198 [Branchiostoma floridae]